MAKITPFRGTRPVRDKVHLVASRSYVSYTPANLKGKLNTNPFSFIHIINPDYNSTGRKSRGKEKFRRIREKYLEFIRQGIFKKEAKPVYYLYEQRFHEHTYIGVIAGISVADYQSGHILKHEATLQKRENMFAEYLKTTGFNAEPVLLTHRGSDDLRVTLERIKQERPEYEFTTADRAEHRVWIVEDSLDMNFITQYYDSIDELYIADGHHRTASSATLSEWVNGENKGNSEAPHFFMALLIADDSLHIDSFYRLVSVVDTECDKLIKSLGELFELTLSSTPPRNEDLAFHEFSMYLNGKWYLLKLKELQKKSTRPIDQLDAQILTDTILTPLLGIGDLRSDPRISFEPGFIKSEDIARKVDKGTFAIAFGMRPVEMDQMRSIAKSGCVMPPKTTYIEPKLRSGLVIYDLKETP